jgi:hypothetical protein
MPSPVKASPGSTPHVAGAPVIAGESEGMRTESPGVAPRSTQAQHATAAQTRLARSAADLLVTTRARAPAPRSDRAVGLHRAVVSAA